MATPSSSAKKRKKVTETTEKDPNQEEEEEKEEEEGEEEEEESEEVSKDHTPSNGSRIFVQIESDVLNCPICFGALLPPIHQCSNGHVVCSACCVRLTGKCAFCSQFMGIIRCLALEKVLESIKLRCRNANYGCHARPSYLQKEEHHESCMYTPCSCPVSSCSFKGGIKNLSEHYTHKHKNSAVEFSYRRHFRVPIPDEEFLILISQDKHLFLLLVNCDVVAGKTLSVICICPANEDNEFMYELSVEAHPTHLKLKSSGEMTYEWKGVYPKIVLFVPDSLCTAKTNVDLFIQKVKRV